MNLYMLLRIKEADSLVKGHSNETMGFSVVLDYLNLSEKHLFFLDQKF